MKSLMSIALLFLAVSCDSPQRRPLSAALSSGNGLVDKNPSPTDTTTGFTGGGSTGATGGGTTKPAGFENCDLTKTIYKATINNMSICQSTLDETSVAVYSSTSDVARTCLIPTYRDSAGNSMYLGQPQCYTPKANTTTMGSIYKTRSGYTGYAINGVMIMKEASLGAYFNCMDAYVNFPASSTCPYGSKTNAYCDSAARANMTAICNNFKTANYFLDVSFK